MAKRIQQESGEERVTAKIKTYDEFNSEDAIGRVVFNFIKPGEDMVRISRSWENLLQVDDRIRANLIDSSPTGYSKFDYGRSWSSQEWKSGGYGARSIRENLIKLLGI